jgi:hypothetical protein
MYAVMPINAGKSKNDQTIEIIGHPLLDALNLLGKYCRMLREKVSSSSLRSVGYDPSRLVLEIEFRTGGIYQYLNVPERVYLELLTDESMGRYFDYSIRDNYVCKKIK